MIKFNSEDISAMEKFYRINVINSLAGYKALHLAGTANRQGVSNLCLVSSVFHLGANPPLIGMVMRPQRAHNDTLRNIQSTGHYTLNNVLPEWYMQAHQTSASYAAGESEFDLCGFERSYTDGFNAPFVAQSTIRIGLELQQAIDIEINGTTIVIGKIVYILADEDLIAPDGFVDPVKAQTMTVAGLDSYYLPQPVGRLAYAKPGVPSAELTV
ncbi:flavin reductase family protein [Mucilaginibacter phyllosphaerae]|uniref:Flavin reductase (DIM6/NTAB) family NADH-FMN oxidoreductase RutF n=1 Tax=Mucilaginibacter phyllosphaerae TaxID=1812349 RepID=A0A4Y8AJP8_9SPHI|nr:flavin reductase [Mucilaginibacter phyllosphaerae]MBB3968117.1 flavin reductase (DIM6/NTAB) family NADH-FMN oxidoreductase RutF [Mucilaginibacter phyllosphaerae]TEW68862.1 flavin reductase family protein [Mucilaginibacter phyllosphaerae]GGH01138.1 flavin oxidoreductase [Mucilaginibacter phyllosphaerae]